MLSVSVQLHLPPPPVTVSARGFVVIDTFCSLLGPVTGALGSQTCQGLQDLNFKIF